MAVVATGGYGRGLMAPESDIDLLFILPYKQTAWGEQVAEAILYCLWDMGLKVGHATRSVDESIRQARGDMTIRTAILETRFLTGDQPLYDELVDRFDREVVQGTASEFVTAKLAEREERHRRGGQSRYLVEPNVKDGKGGLRDLHTLFWIAKYVYRVHDVEELIDRGVFDEDELKLFRRCEDFQWSVRCNMHFLTGRAEERLSFDIQREIAVRLGYTEHPGMKDVERFMKHYFLTAKDVEIILRRMNETGVLGRFVRAFGRVVAMMQFNMYHHYTVDEHLLRCIGILAEIERGSNDEFVLASDLMRKILPEHRTLLYVALFLHDIAKVRIEDHSIAGARIARVFCPRLAMSDV